MSQDIRFTPQRGRCQHCDQLWVWHVPSISYKDVTYCPVPYDQDGDIWTPKLPADNAQAERKFPKAEESPMLPVGGCDTTKQDVEPNEDELVTWMRQHNTFRDSATYENVAKVIHEWLDVPYWQVTNTLVDLILDAAERGHDQPYLDDCCGGSQPKDECCYYMPQVIPKRPCTYDPRTGECAGSCRHCEGYRPKLSVNECDGCAAAYPYTCPDCGRCAALGDPPVSRPKQCDRCCECGTLMTERYATHKFECSRRP